VTGQLAVTQALLPLLRLAQGRVVLIGSIGTRFTPPFTGPLSASKSAVATMAEALRHKLAHQPAPGSRVVPEAAETNGQPAKAERVRSAPTAAWRQNP